MKGLLLFIGLVMAITFSNSCGDGGTKYEYKDPGGSTPPPAQPDAPEDKEALAIAFASVVKNCTSCHSTIQAPPLRNENEISANRGRVCVRVKDGTMPPAGSKLSAADKAAILAGFGC